MPHYVVSGFPCGSFAVIGLCRRRNLAVAKWRRVPPAVDDGAEGSGRWSKSIHSIYVIDQVRHLRKPSISFKVAAMDLRPKPSASPHHPIRVPPSALVLCLPPIPELLPDVLEDITREVRRRLGSMYPTVEPEPRAVIGFTPLQKKWRVSSTISPSYMP